MSLDPHWLVESSPLELSEPAPRLGAIYLKSNRSSESLKSSETCALSPIHPARASHFVFVWYRSVNMLSISSRISQLLAYGITLSLLCFLLHHTLCFLHLLLLITQSVIIHRYIHLTDVWNIKSHTTPIFSQ